MLQGWGWVEGQRIALVKRVICQLRLEDLRPIVYYRL